MSDVLRSGTDSTNGQEDVLFQEHSGEHLNLLGEGGGEHEGLSLLDTGHVLTFNNSSDLGLETHVQHSIGLVEDKVFDVGKGNSSSLHQVDQSSRSSGKEIASSVKSSDLLTDIGTTVNNGGSDPGSVSEFSSLVVNLRNKLSSRSQDQSSRVGLSSTVAHVWGRSDGTVAEHGGEDGEEETTGLSRTSLSTGHEVSTTGHDGDRVLLDRGGGGVSGISDVLQEDRVDRRVRELDNGLRDAVTGGLDGDVGVLVKVDTARLFVRLRII